MLEGHVMVGLGQPLYAYCPPVTINSVPFHSQSALVWLIKRRVHAGEVMRSRGSRGRRRQLRRRLLQVLLLLWASPSPCPDTRCTTRTAWTLLATVPAGTVSAAGLSFASLGCRVNSGV